MMHSVISMLLFTLLLSVVILFAFPLLQRRQRPLPPGPTKWPIFGNVFDLPTKKEWITFTEWGKTYGDVVHLSIFGTSIIVLNSSEAAAELLDKRSSIYSDRPYIVMGGVLIGWIQTLFMAPYGEHFRKMRKHLHQVLSPLPAQAFWPLQEQSTVRFLDRLLSTPEDFLDHIRHAAGTIILDMSHGYQALEKDDPFINLAEDTIRDFAEFPIGAFLVDFIPWLRHIPGWVPGAGFQGAAAKWRKKLSNMCDRPYEFAQAQMRKGEARPSFTSFFLETECTPESEYVVKWAAVSLYVGGADTTVATLSSFFLATCTHPHVQAVAQAELDAVIGRERLPTIEDRERLPYIDAVMKEVIRWGTNTPFAVPHRLMKDDEYKGYRIPSGSVVMPNVWGMLHDPEIYPNPFDFIPERFSSPGKDSGASTNPDPLRIAFGFGRRACPGQYFAESSVFIAIAMTLATFEISRALDGQGNVIIPELEWMPGAVSHPKPFQCRIKHRSAQAASLIKVALGDQKA